MHDLQVTGYLVFGSSPPDIPSVYALLKNSPPDCFCPPVADTVAFESLMTIPRQKSKGVSKKDTPLLF